VKPAAILRAARLSVAAVALAGGASGAGADDLLPPLLALEGERLEGPGTLVLGEGDWLVGHGAVATDVRVHGTVWGMGPEPEQGIELSGDVSGDGTFAGRVVVSGTLRPGNSPACVAFDDLTLTATSTLEIEIGGTTPCSQHDRLVLAGTLTLQSGGLRVLLIDGFTPSVGQVFVYATAASITGGFNLLSVELPPLPAGRWVIGKSATELRLRVASSTGCGLLGAEPVAVLAIHRLLRRRRRGRVRP
jgi:hypothetical protein